MRIIAGELGGRKIKPPFRMPHTRPTTDMSREGLFNILQNRIDLDGITVLDLYAGTGAISYELASRGAGKLVAVEKDPAMASFIKNTARSLLIENFEVITGDVLNCLNNLQTDFDFIFADPPYGLQETLLLPKLIADRKLLKKDGLFVLEHTVDFDFAKFSGCLFSRKYGSTIFSFFSYV